MAQRLVLLALLFSCLQGTYSRVCAQDCSANLLEKFPTAKSPYVIDEHRWRKDSKSHQNRLDDDFVRSYLNQAPSGDAAFYAVARVDIKDVEEPLTGLIVRYEGVEGGYNDVYYLIALSPNGSVRATLELARFSATLLDETVSTTTISTKPFLVRKTVTYSKAAKGKEPGRKIVAITCFDFLWSGLPESLPCE